MPLINRSALVPYGPARMYALVDDVPRYPEFLPWCEAAEVHSDDGRIQEASLHVAKGPFRDHFRTRNTRTPDVQIELELVDGPFSQLEGRWTFAAMGEGSKVTLELRFEFASAMVARSLSPVFEAIADGMLDAFVTRAKRIYE
jgi:ribosome-associated toxin RatA of RatAB toxin-antitoxin module